MEKQALEVITSLDDRLNGSIRQRQRRLTEAQVAKMVTKYVAGATVYELAAEFGYHRTTVAGRLKRAGIAMRLQSPRTVDMQSTETLYESGLSYSEIGRQLGYAATTVRNYPREHALAGSARSRCGIACSDTEFKRVFRTTEVVE